MASHPRGGTFRGDLLQLSLGYTHVQAVDRMLLSVSLKVLTALFWHLLVASRVFSLLECRSSCLCHSSAHCTVLKCFDVF